VAKIQRVARGFNGLLGLKSGGLSPSDVQEFVQPTLGMLAFYEAQLGPLVTGNSGGLGAIGAGLNVTIPQGELWSIHNIMGRIQHGAGGQNYALALIYQGPIAGGGLSDLVLASRRPGAALNAAAENTVTYQQQEPLFLPGGSVLRFEITDATGGFAGVTGNIQVLHHQIASFPGSEALTL